MALDGLVADGSATLPLEASGLPPRSARLRRVLAHASTAELRLWLTVGEHDLADVSLPAARRLAAAEQAAACRALMAPPPDGVVSVND
ncbi:MAG TPA: hypothetical protein VFQ80_17545 [Thermomicrobiales bacterium]|nr:hypothetical protein [Thermomicrobiales bacterium]